MKKDVPPRKKKKENKKKKLASVEHICKARTWVLSSVAE